MRSFAFGAIFLFVFDIIAPSWAASTQSSTQETLQLPSVVDAKQWSEAKGLVARASTDIVRFRSNPKMVALMHHAKGILVIPAFGHGSSGFTGAWGSAMLMANNKGQWSDAAFFTLGGGSLGPHVIANGGALVLFIMNDRAMATFESASNWSLSSSPGMNIVSYSAATPQDMSGNGADIVAWSASGAPNADTEIEITDISADNLLNGAVYGTEDLRKILVNHVPYINQDVINLRREMPSSKNVVSGSKYSSSSSRPVNSAVARAADPDCFGFPAIVGAG